MPSAKWNKRIGELLVESNLIKEDVLLGILAEQKGSQKKLGELLVDRKLCTEEEIASILSTQLGLPMLDLKNTPVEPMAIELIPEKLARKHMIVPLTIEDKALSVAMVDPLSYSAFEEIRFASGLMPRPFVATRADVLWAIDHHYNLGDSLEALVHGLTKGKPLEVLPEFTGPDGDADDLKRKSEAGPIIRIVNMIISQAVEQRGSDIHLEPAKDKLVTRYRVDGVLRTSLELPRWVQGAVISRIKIMSRMDIAEKRLPQDGRIGVKVAGRSLDLRVSTIPTIYGEKVVLRILDPKDVILTVDGLGLVGATREKLQNLITTPQGILLVTGPTGSGKTTTLYAVLSSIKTGETNITTIEDPIEYELEGINQVAINEKISLSFATVLRAMLRQDPDVLMVGEMRDLETATIAMQAALTGHLVLSTVHTNSSVATITRLRNLGLAPYLVASTINGILAQRLVRVICSFCMIPDPKPGPGLAKLGVPEELAGKITLYRGAGCKECGGTGYHGRTGLYELLVFSRRIRELIAVDASETDVRQAAQAEGMKTLMQEGLDKVIKGVTTVDEVFRVVQTGEVGASICRTCGFMLNLDFVTCPQCGTDVYPACPSCRKMVDPAWNFCPYCHQGLPGTASPR